MQQSVQYIQATSIPGSSPRHLQSREDTGDKELKQDGGWPTAKILRQLWLFSNLRCISVTLSTWS